MLKVWLSPVEKNLRKSKPELKNINISRGWKKVKIEFEEREPIAVVKVKDRLCGVDKDNIPFPLRGKWILDSSEKLPRINVDDTAFRQDVLDFIGTVKLKAEKLYDNISCVYTEPSDTVVFVQRNETKILWGTPNKSGFNDKLGKLYMIQADAAKRFSGLEYINLCYFDDGRIIVKPRIITTNTR
jgi:cell division protein FtsQ